MQAVAEPASIYKIKKKFYSFRLEIPILLDRVEARTVLTGIEIMMADDDSIREIRMITLHELAQGPNLIRCASVLWLTSRIQPALVA